MKSRYLRDWQSLVQVELGIPRVTEHGHQSTNVTQLYDSVSWKSPGQDKLWMQISHTLYDSYDNNLNIEAGHKQ